MKLFERQLTIPIDIGKDIKKVLKLLKENLEITDHSVVISENILFFESYISENKDYSYKTSFIRKIKYSGEIKVFEDKISVNINLKFQTIFTTLLPLFPLSLLFLIKGSMSNLFFFILFYLFISLTWILSTRNRTMSVIKDIFKKTKKEFKEHMK